MDKMQNPGITHIRFYFGQIDMLERALNNEQMGRLFFAVADYAQTGEYKVMDGPLVFPYEMLVRAIDKGRQNQTAEASP